ncbi:SMP-30/gluconolactonase/LRE family protein [Siphonobacter sp. SORGH_AS_0500]|uniref:SMP-30/gluconolactonase/LRE family protein n=1 Tax=Siphonobacter sp. SORGH_AS_0500 TaxID=1864824 RepID=UPI002856C9AB|nr:SMP-30/gluconolactonase/LRE family protein [Siphonobacter sp. SORGH_AS_0500]MDR6194025.1 gluconolactonase [Siphonobacter sp. SORGH_AS_0500]
MKLSYLVLIPLAFASCNRQASTAHSSKKDLYVSRDFTAENQFSTNIEGPSFDKAGHLYVVNFRQDGTLGKIDANGQGEVFVTLPNKSIANAIQFNSQGEMLLADFVNHNVLKVNMQTKQVSVFAHDDRFNQPNDICITKKDVIYASDPSWKDNTGKLWKVTPEGKTILLLENLGTTNGITLSPDEKTLYVNESAQRKIWKYDLDAEGNVQNKTLFHEFTDFGMDGMKCDKKGNLYCTRHGKGTIAVLSPAGKLIREIPLKGKSCSNLVFGGKDKKTVYVTLQDRKGMEQFRVETPGK